MPYGPTSATLNNVGMSDNQHNLRAALDRARSGDMDAFAEVFEHYRPLLLRIAYRYVGSTDADDVVMDTFLKVWRALPGFKGASSLKTWLCRIVRNCALDHLRRQRRTDGRASSLDRLDEDGRPVEERVADARAVSPDQGALRAELVRMLEDAIAGLPDHHRITIELRELDGCSYREVAAATGVSIGTVMSRLHHARRRLRSILGDIEL